MERDIIQLDEVAADQETVSALSYNILCDKYCTPSQYGYTPSGALDWEHRRGTILAELRDRDADILCLQEIDMESYDNFFRPALAHNDYKGMFSQKTRARTMADKDAKLVDGCAIFYKHSKYVSKPPLARTALLTVADTCCWRSRSSISLILQSIVQI